MKAGSVLELEFYPEQKKTWECECVEYLNPGDLSPRASPRRHCSFWIILYPLYGDDYATSVTTAC